MRACGRLYCIGRGVTGAGDCFGAEGTMPKKLLLLRPLIERLRLPSKLPSDSLNPNSSPKLKPGKETRRKDGLNLHHFVIRKVPIIVILRAGWWCSVCDGLEVSKY